MRALRIVAILGVPLVFVAVPLAARAQQMGKVPSLGFLFHGRQALVREVETAARLLRLDVRVLEVARREDFDAAFSVMAKARVGAVTVLPIAFLTGERQRITELALRYRLPSIFHWKEYIDAGGLMSYGASRTELMRRAASHVDKILKGAKPGDLPVEQATTFELIVNLKTARALGLTIPPSLLARATEVIE